MNPTFQRLMHEATQLTSAGNLKAATAAIQRALGRSAAGPAAPVRADQDATILDGYVAEQPNDRHAPTPTPTPTSTSTPQTAPHTTPAGPGAFLHGSHTHAGLTRDYKLFVPPAVGRQPPLVVMLHGCTQDPDDFAAGTGMNELARELGFLVLYPAQAKSANPSRCWNWFKHSHQGRGRGEAGVIATMAQAVMQERGVNPARVYIAGLSAGGAMAAIVAAAYPQLFAAVGVHSGLAPGAAQSLPEALAAMRAGAEGAAGAAGAPGRSGPGLPVPAIVFHGDRDATVNPRNGDQVVAAVLASAWPSKADRAGPAVVQEGVSRQGQRYTRTVHGGEGGPALAEQWVLHGAGHAWSGGQPAGSYVDTQGPDASREMLRFFFSQAARTGH